MPLLPRLVPRLLLAIALAAPLALAPAAPARAAEVGLPAAVEVAAPAPIVLSAADLPTTLAAAPAPDTTDEEPDLSNLAWRHGHLQVHQALGLATLASMGATVGLGWWLADLNGASGVFDGHLMMAGLTSGLYLAAGTLSLTAPPPALKREEGPWDTTKLHRNLAWLHAAGMGATVGLGLMTALNSLSFSQYHALAGYTTYGLMALSAGVIVFGE